jgi:hypothetical protein
VTTGTPPGRSGGVVEEYFDRTGELATAANCMNNAGRSEINQAAQDLLILLPAYLAQT